MTHATVKSLRTEKGFGFVTQADGHDVFFHVSAVGSQLFNSLTVGTPVKIETGKNEKGLFVKTLSVLPRSEAKPVETRYAIPNGFIKSSSDTPARGAVFYRRAIQSDYFRNPEEAEQSVRDEIKRTGANALLGAKMVQEKKRSGNYYYRVFSMSGTAALVMNETRSTAPNTFSLDEARIKGRALNSRTSNNTGAERVAYDNAPVETHDNEQIPALGAILLAVGVMAVFFSVLLATS